MMTAIRVIPAWVFSVVLCLCAWASTARAEKVLWHTDFEAAKAKAKAEQKLLLVDFTGSDWCGWCIKLKDEVFDKQAFEKEAPKAFVLVELDFPHNKELSEKLKKQNEQLAKQYKIEGFPSILLLDAAGEVIARTGYRPDGPKAYLKHLDEFVTIHKSIVDLRAKLAATHGLERAKLLDQLIEAYGKLDNEVADIGPWSKEIIALDADNAAGLKVKYQFRTFMAEAAAAKESEKFADAQALVAKALALPGLSGQQKQDGYFAQGEFCFLQKDFPGVVASLKLAIAAAPDSDKVSGLKDMIGRFTAAADAQSAVNKLTGELEKAKGLDRAKVLDQLIGAETQLAPFARNEGLAEKTDKWSREIVALDTDNKAGLKAKYAFRIQLADARKLLQAQKFEEGQAAIEKALALPELTAAQIQEGNLLAGNCAFVRKDYQGCITALNKALKAAPETRRAAGIQAMIQRAEEEWKRQKADQAGPEKASKKAP
jgi:thioredoxin-related protein